jgi:transcriptional regulator with XRE-family HTH domain
MTGAEAKLLKALGEHVRKTRKRRGYSQDRVYLEAGFSRGTMSRIEAGKVNPTYLTLYKIAKTIGVSVRQLLEPEESR